jgi:hypothetical protein
MKNVFKINLIFLLLLSASMLFAQEDVLRPKGKPSGNGSEESYTTYKKKPFTLGFEGGLNYNMFSADLSWNPALQNSAYNAYGSGKGFSPYFGVLVDIPFNNEFGIQFRGSLDWKYFKNNFTGDANAVADNGQLVYGNLDISYNVTALYGGLGALIRWNITPNLLIMVGPIIQFPMGNFTQEETWTALSDNLYLIDPTTLNHVKILTSKTNEPNVNNRFALEFDLGYKLNISRNIWLVPQARFQYGLTKLVEDISGQDITFRLPDYTFSDITDKNRKLHSLQFVLSLWFDL